MLIQDCTRASRKALLFLTGLSENSFHKMRTAGVFKPLDRGVYDLREALAAWLKYYLDGAKPGDLSEARRLLCIAQEEKTRLDIKARERELVPLAEAQAIFDRTMILIGGQLDGLAGRMAGELAGMADPAEIRTALFYETRRIRDEAARQLTDWITGGPGGPAPGPATPEDSGPVGG